MVELVRETVDKADWQILHDFMETKSQDEKAKFKKACSTTVENKTVWNLQKARAYVKKNYFAKVSPADLFKDF